MLKPPPPIPLTLVTGFLGAGKTTLLNRVLKDDAFAGSIVLVNEFGEIGLDHLLIEGMEEDMILLESGCLCCTIRGDLIATLENLLRRRDNGRIAPFSRLVIETTGLADPAPILNVVVAHPYLALRYRLDGVVTLVDAANGVATLNHHREALRQLVVADMVVLTKTDLAPAGETSALRQLIARLNPGVAILDAAAGEATAGRLIGLGRFDVDAKPAEVRDWLAEEAALRPMGAGHAHDHAHPHTHEPQGPVSSSAREAHTHAHEHDPNRHDARIRAFVLSADTPIRQASFDLFWNLLRASYGPKLLRLKGLVHLAETPERPLVVHAVQSVLHEPTLLQAWPETERRSRLVIITDDLDPAIVERLWAAFLGQNAAGANASG